MRRKKRIQKPNIPSGSLFIFTITIALAVLVGFAGTKYIIYPFFLNSSAPNESENNVVDDQKVPDGGTVIVDERDIQEIDTAKNTAQDQEKKESEVDQALSLTLYSLQFGNFMDKSNAEILADSLKKHNLATYILPSDGTYKVIGIPFREKERAAKSANNLNQFIQGVFVAPTTVRFADEDKKAELVNLLDDYSNTDNLTEEEKQTVLLNKQESIIIVMKNLMIK